MVMTYTYAKGQGQSHISVMSHLATLSRNFDSCVKFAGVTSHLQPRLLNRMTNTIPRQPIAIDCEMKIATIWNMINDKSQGSVI